MSCSTSRRMWNLVVAAALLLVAAHLTGIAQATCAPECGEGEKCEGSSCVNCEPGTFQTADNHNETSCDNCGSGSFSGPGDARCQSWKSCGSGKRWVAGSATEDASCVDCDAGMFQAQSGHQLTTCESCTSGKFSAEGASGCTSWKNCGQGKRWSEGSATQDASCSNCGPGTYQDKRSHQMDTCKTCEAGTFQANSGRAGCTSWKSCDPGEKWSAGSKTQDASCSACDSETFQDADDHQQTSCMDWSDCSFGQRVTAQPTQSSDRECQDCGFGKYQNSLNSPMCEQCLAGEHQNQRGQSACKACEDGKYQDERGKKNCITFSSCGQGNRWIEGSPTTDSTCQSCREGKYQNADSHKIPSCKTCDAGKYQLNSGQSSCMACNTCAAGFTEQVACTPTSDRECADVTDPVIILVRPDDQETLISEADNIYTVEAGLGFVPPKASATDSAMQGVTLVEPTDMEINTIDTSSESSDQTLTYTATDAAGNKATRTITVVVDDTSGPDITFSPATLFLEAGDPVSRSNYTRGVTILDKVDGMLDISLLVIDSSNVKVNKLGEYTITYTLSEPDSAGNEAPPTIRTVVVHDTLNPVLNVDFGDREVLDGNLIVHEAAAMFPFPSTTATDTFDTEVTGNDVRLQETPDFTSIADDGTRFQLTYSVTDASGNTATETFTVEVRDTIAPAITVTGAASVDHEAGTVYTDMGFTATDALEDELGRDIQTSTLNDVNSNPPSVPANFMVEYEACDAAGNCATDTRQVRVDDTTPPAITLNDNATLMVEAGQAFSDIDPGVTLSDLYYDNTDLTLTIDDGGYTGKPATTPATFTVTYAVEDPSGNKASIERTVVVVDTTPPDLRLNGEAEVVVGDGREWQEPGVARAQDILDGDLLQNVKVTIQLMDVGAVERQQCEASSAHDFVPPLTPRVWSEPASDIVTSDAPGGTVYGVRYAVTDAAGNEAVRERVVRVEDNSTPSLALLGAEVQTLEYTTSEDGAFVESDGGAVSTDAHDGDLSGSICVGVVADTTAARGVLSLSSVETTARAAIANVQQRLRTMTTNASHTTSAAANRNMLSTLDTAVASAKVGTVYVVQYTVHDRAGRMPSPLYRAVVVMDTTPPQLTLIGKAEVRVPYATLYDEAGYTAVDTHDGDVTAAVVVSGANVIDVHVAGTYTVTYTVVDANGNEAVVTRAVVVEARPQPEALKGLVVELVLAGTPNDLFNSDEQELEMMLEETLGVDFVVVFLLYNKRDGRPSTTARRALDARDDIAGTTTSSSSSAIASSPSSSSSASRRRRRTGRGLLAEDQTVVEFGVRNSTDLSSFVSAEEIVKQLHDASVGNGQVVNAETFKAPKEDGGSLSGGAVVGIVIALAVVLMGGLFGFRRWRQAKPAPAEATSTAPVDDIVAAPNPTFLSGVQQEGEVTQGQLEREHEPVYSTVYDVIEPKQQRATRQAPRQGLNTMHSWSPGLYDVGGTGPTSDGSMATPSAAGVSVHQEEHENNVAALALPSVVPIHSRSTRSIRSHHVKPAPATPTEGGVKTSATQVLSIHSWMPETYDVDQRKSGQRGTPQPVYEFVKNAGGVSKT